MIQETRILNQEEKKKKLSEARSKAQLWASKQLNKNKRKQKSGKRLTQSTYPEKPQYERIKNISQTIQELILERDELKKKLSKIEIAIQVLQERTKGI